MSQEPPSVNDAESDESKSAASTEQQEHEDVRISAESGTSDEGGREATAEGDADARSEADPELSSRDAALETKAPDADDDSLDAILLEASRASAQESLGARKSLSSKTLMGIGIDGLMLPGRTKSADAEADLDSAIASPSEATEREGETPEIIESKAASALHEDEKATTSLLDDVANALATQASEFRDKARGRLPGMPGSVSPSPSSDFRSASAMGAAEFEDPDEDKTSLTPAMIPVVEEAGDFVIDTELRADAEADSDAEPDSDAEADVKLVSGDAPVVVEAPILAFVSRGADRSGDKEGKVSKVPPAPGLAGSPVPAPVGPPPGAPVRLSTPAAGLTSGSPSGRVRLPTPGPGVALPTLSLPAPPVGRTTLPPGALMSPVVGVPGVSQDLTATSPSTPISIEASRRISEAVATTRGSRSGRVSSRASVQVAEPTLRTSSAVTTLPAILNAHVKLATLNLAGLIALTFAGGLFVGMLVWRGQGRGDLQSGTHPTVATQPIAPATPRAVQPVVEVAKSETAPVGAAPVAGSQPGTAAVVSPAAVVVAGTAAGMAQAAARSTTTKAAGTRPDVKNEAVVAPLTASTPDSNGAPVSTEKKPVAARTAAKPRRVVPLADEAGTEAPSPPAPTAVAKATTVKPIVASKPPAASLKPAAFRPAAVAAPAPSAASKPVATNTAAKPAAKAKAKAAWHDPFAD